MQAVTRGPYLDTQCCHREPGRGHGLAALLTAACTQWWLLGSVAAWGLRLVGGRSWRAAPLEALDVPPAGLSGRSRSCPNRSRGSQHQLLQLAGLGQLCGVQGLPLPLCCLHWALPPVGVMTLVLGHRTPGRRMPWGVGIPPSVLLQESGAGAGPGAS